MKCLILGGGGFLGSHLSDALLAEGYAVRIFERPNLKKYRDFSDDEDIEWVEGDFANQENICQAVRGCEIIYHLVSTTLPKTSNENPVYDIESNVVNSVYLAAQAMEAKVRKIIFISSGGTVYGIPEEAPIKENHPTNPICSYGISKLTIEKYLQLYYRLYGLDYCVLRLSNPYGERQRPTTDQGAVGVFSYKALKNETIEIWGDGNIVRDYVYVGDVVDAFIKAINVETQFRLFNIGSGQKHTLNEILDELENLLGRPVLRRYTSSRSLDVPINILNIERAERYLHWSPKVDFRFGLEKTLDWYKRKLCRDL